MENVIDQYLKDRNIVPAKFAREIGIPNETLANIRKGRTKFDGIGIGTFIKIAHGLNMTAEELYYGKPEIVDPVRTEILSVFDSTTDEGKKSLLTSAKTVKEMYSQ